MAPFAFGVHHGFALHAPGGLVGKKGVSACGKGFSGSGFLQQQLY
jgi:hypothetical protein